SSVVIFKTQMSDQVFSTKITQRVFEFHQLDKDIVFRIKAGRGLRRFEVEGKPLLNSLHAGALSQVEKQRQIQDDWRRENRVAAEKIDFDLHRVAQPAEDIDIVPTFFIVAARWVVVDANDVGKIFIEVRIDFGLKNVLEH